MRKLPPFLLLGIILLAMASCQKEKSDEPLNGTGDAVSTGSEKGTWKFISTFASTSESVVYNDGIKDVKTVTIWEYTTENNAGTIKFDASKITSTGLTYSVDGIAEAYLYLNGSLADSLEFPFAATIPPTWERVET